MLGNGQSMFGNGQSVLTQCINDGSCCCFWCGQLAECGLCVLLTSHQLRQASGPLKACPCCQRHRLIRVGHESCGELPVPAAPSSR